MDNKEMTTQEVFESYFSASGMKADTMRKLRPQVDRPEVFRYEEQIGKQVFDMDVDELFDMIQTFGDNRRVKGEGVHFGISYASYDQIASLFRQIFNWYADNVKLIRNPWNDKRMRGVEASKRLAQGKETFTTETMNDIIQKVRDFYDDDRADYTELTILLFYCGFAEAIEVAEMKERDIDFKRHNVRISGRTVHLSDRCFELLCKVHNMSDLGGWRGDYVMASWNDSYFKFAIRPKEEKAFNDRTPVQVSAQINQIILTMVKKKLNVNINYRMLYLLGFYDFICEKVGKDKAKEILTSSRDKDDVRDFRNLANIYGMNVASDSHLKRSLRPFVEGIED